jgi:hypothetical protein
MATHPEGEQGPWLENAEIPKAKIS